MHILAIIGQIIFGFYWLRNGFQHFRFLNNMAGYAGSKGVPMPKLAVAGSGALLLIGGLGLLLGVYTWWAILALVIFLVLVTPKMHNYWAASPDHKMAEQINFNKNLALLGALLLLWQLPILAYALF